MGVAGNILNEFKGWIALAIFVVVGSIVLLNFKDVANVACGSEFSFNSSTNLCHNVSNESLTQAISTTGAAIDLFVTGLSEPANWIVIVAIAIIGIAILLMFSRKLK